MLCHCCHCWQPASKVFIFTKQRQKIMYSCLVFFKIMSLLQTYSRLKIKLFPIHWIYSVKFDKILIVNLFQSRHIAILWQNHDIHSLSCVLRIDIYRHHCYVKIFVPYSIYIHMWNWTDGTGLDGTNFTDNILPGVVWMTIRIPLQWWFQRSLWIYFQYVMRVSFKKKLLNK